MSGSPAGGGPAKLTEEALFMVLPDGCASGPAEKKTDDSWEDLWRLYHRSVNNEARKNLRLQRQFMPERYQKYLTELK